MLTALAIVLGISSQASAAPEAWQPTPPGVVEVKVVPAVRLMESRAGGTYFASEGSVFRPLFRYLQTHELSMTSPVEVDVQRNAMRFVVDPRDTRPLEDWGGVEVDSRPGRTVLSVGMTGAYSEARYLDGVQRLQGWLRDNPEWMATGEPIAVYWNGPYVPGPLKRSEVHLPVARVQ